MVCVPCIVIPVLLWVFHKFIQPLILKFWNPWQKSVVQTGNSDLKESDKETQQYKHINNLLTENPVVVFSKTACSFSKMAKNVLDGINVVYVIEELDKREDTDAMQDILQKMTGARTVPRVFIGQHCVGGGSETWSLHNQDKLVPMMKEAGAVFKEGEKKTD